MCRGRGDWVAEGAPQWQLWWCLRRGGGRRDPLVRAGLQESGRRDAERVGRGSGRVRRRAARRSSRVGPAYQMPSSPGSVVHRPGVSVHRPCRRAGRTTTLGRGRPPGGGWGLSKLGDRAGSPSRSGGWAGRPRSSRGAASRHYRCPFPTVSLVQPDSALRRAGRGSHTRPHRPPVSRRTPAACTRWRRPGRDRAGPAPRGSRRTAGRWRAASRRPASASCPSAAARRGRA